MWINRVFRYRGYEAELSSTVVTAALLRRLPRLLGPPDRGSRLELATGGIFRIAYEMARE